MAYPYPRTDPAKTVERFHYTMTFDFQGAALTVTWGEGAKSEAYEYVGVYSAGTDYTAGQQVWYTDRVYLCLDTNGPGSAVKTPGETLWWTGADDYSLLVDYVLGNIVYYNTAYWRCLVANGPGSACVEPVEGANWTADTYSVNGAGMITHSTDRVAQRTLTWTEIVALTTGEFTEDELLDLFYVQGGLHLNFLGKNLYDALKAAGQEPLPTP